LAILLHIDTATEKAGVCISQDEKVLAVETNDAQKNHASFVQPAIQALLKNTGIVRSQIDAISVTAGPGSYTGLRVGMATAKGLAYALNKPLILKNTLEVMAYAAIQDSMAVGQINANMLFCPMIDARRMEVFTGLYDAGLQIVTPPYALILEPDSFDSYLIDNNITFSGNGHYKYKEIIQNKKVIFTDVKHDVNHLSILAFNAYLHKQFADIAYSEPFYLKEFFTAK
jgi:tRNA threonylcarbamoyladenosine biosynthesis protein TsaB